MIKKIKFIVIISISYLLIWSCASSAASSMEFRSAKTSARSEKNLKKAEEYAVLALKLDAHATDASVPYFLAIEIFKPQKKWMKMAEMLDEAMLRNPTQKLERPIVMGKNNVLTTIEQAVMAYKDELWGNLYNEALDSYNKGEVTIAMEQFNAALKVDPEKVQTYIVLAKFSKENNNIEEASRLLDSATALQNISKEQKTELLLTKAEIYKEQMEMNEALKYYELAYSESNSITSILSILEIKLISEDWLQAIEWGERAMVNRSEIDRMYFGLLLYNIGLAYRGAATSYYDIAADVINRMNNNENIQLALKKDSINNFNIAKDYFEIARTYFIDADIEEMDGANLIAKQMKNIIKQITEVYIPFLEKDGPKE